MEETRVVSRTCRIDLAGTLDEVFPLFGPIKEQEWAEGWHPRIVWPNSDVVQEHMVFQTDSHGSEDPSSYTWIVSRYAPESAEIEYTVFAEERVWWIAINCYQEEGSATSRAEITYTYLGLTEHGHQLNRLALGRMFQHDLKDWEIRINHYLETGTRMGHDPT
jgi:hypothetical protein